MEREDGGFDLLGCPNTATHYSCTPIIDTPVCAEHRCRCAGATIARRAAEEAPTPTEWMAL